MGWKPSVERLETLLVRSRRAELVPLLASRSWMFGGSPWQPSLVGMDVELFPIPETVGLSFPWLTLVHQVHWQKGSTPRNTSSSEKERNHFSSSLNSFTPSASKCGPPPAGGLISSAQCWRALAYATTFSQGISQISLHAYIDSASGINLHLPRHGSAGGAWRLASFIPNSHILCGSQKEAHTSLASFL